MTQLDWDDLRFLLAAARAGSLAGAARALGVKHSTVGRRLDTLESALGGALVVRDEHGLRLTGLGADIVSRAEAVEQSILGMQADLSARTALVRVAAPTGFVQLLSPDLVRFRSEHPGISIELLSGSQPADLSRGEAELALRVGPVTDEALVVRKLGELEWSLYGSPAYLARRSPPRDPRDLSGQDVLGFDARLAGVPGAKWLAQYGTGTTVTLVHREIADMAASAVAGLGLAVLPRTAEAGEPRLQRLSEEVLGRQNLSLAYRREVLLSAPVRIVSKFLMHAVRERLKKVQRQG